jgi:hypothetical protein
MDVSLASTHVINHLRRSQEQQHFNNNDLVELGERLKSVLAKKNSAGGEYMQARGQLTNQSATDMMLRKQSHSAHNNEYVLPLADQVAGFSGSDLIMAQQQAQLQNQGFANFRVNFQSNFFSCCFSIFE